MFCFEPSVIWPLFSSFSWLFSFFSDWYCTECTAYLWWFALALQQFQWLTLPGDQVEIIHDLLSETSIVLWRSSPRKHQSEMKPLESWFRIWQRYNSKRLDNACNFATWIIKYQRLGPPRRTIQIQPLHHLLPAMILVPPQRNDLMHPLPWDARLDLGRALASKQSLGALRGTSSNNFYQLPASQIPKCRPCSR